MNVYQAWAAVMGDVQAVGKDGYNQQQKFNFRGIDGVMNAVGPALRTHGVVVVPKVKDLAIRQYQTSKGTSMKETTVWVRFRVYGPDGDHFDGVTPGESADSGDKSTAKAMSVAYRTFLLQALTIPTDEPDPDEQTHEQGIDERVEQIARTIKAWHETDPRRGKVTENRERFGWPDRLADYNDTQLAACLKLVDQLNRDEPFDLEPEAPSPAPLPEEANPSIDPHEGRTAGQANQQTEAGGGDTANVLPPVTVVFTPALTGSVTGEQITAAADRLGFGDVPRSGSKTLRLGEFSKARPDLTAEEVIDLITTTSKEDA